MKKLLAIVGLVAASAAMPGSGVHGQGAAGPRRAYVADEILIQFTSDASAGERADARSWAGALRKELLRRNGNGELEVARIPGRFMDDALALLRAHPAVRFAEPNYILTHHSESNDAVYTAGQLWGMYGDDLPAPVGPAGTTNQYGSQSEKAWAAGQVGSRNVYVGVIDEGINFNHPDLVNNIWTNPFDPVDGADNDGNGYVDDIHGWDFFQNNNTIFDGGPGSTVDQHGTHVSGTIGGEGGNADGVAGVNWKVTIISGKFLGPSGGSLANAVKAIDYLTDLKTRHGLNIVATSNSWGGGGFSQALLDAIVRGANAGILFVAAAGNGDALGNAINNDLSPQYPSGYNTQAGAGYDAVIAVTALASNGTKATWANYGATSVDLGAPGVGIFSTTPNNTYSSFSGTSMATPHVSGAVALYAAANPGATAAQIKSAILSSVTPTSSISGITSTGGRLNVGTLAGIPPPDPPDPPAAPSDLTATAAGNNRINLSWVDNATTPAEDGFKIERCQGAGCTSFTQIASVGAGATSFANTGLLSSTTYRYRVRAFNTGGDSAYSNEADATTSSAPSPPAAPSNLTATPGPGLRQITLNWQRQREQ